ncbi:hypothetical protein HDU77_005373 [Chytriomyces hyalinus]|nr:hypothetical protein HDU77_005373 [Chytriomyces hyalinus]
MMEMGDPDRDAHLHPITPEVDADFEYDQCDEREDSPLPPHQDGELVSLPEECTRIPDSGNVWASFTCDSHNGSTQWARNADAATDVESLAPSKDRVMMDPVRTFESVPVVDVDLLGYESAIPRTYSPTYSHQSNGVELLNRSDVFAESDYSDKRTAELVNVTMPSTLLAGKRRGWKATDSDSSSKPGHNSHAWQPSDIDSCDNISLYAPPSTRSRTPYWPFTHKSHVSFSSSKSKKKRPMKNVKAVNSRSIHRPNETVGQSESTKSCQQQSNFLFALKMAALISVLATFVLAWCLNKSSIDDRFSQQSRSSDGQQQKYPPPTFDPILSLIEKSADPMIEMLKDVRQLPQGLSLSLSAHTAISLASIIESVRPARTRSTKTAAFDNKRVSESLRDLATSLNLAADSLAMVQSEGYFTVRGIVRLFRGLMREAEGVYAILEETGRLSAAPPKKQQYFANFLETLDCNGHDGPAGITLLKRFIDGMWFGTNHTDTSGCNQPTARSSEAQEDLHLRLDRVLEEMDGMLQVLENHVFVMVEKGQMVHGRWIAANNLAERERRKVRMEVEHVKDDLAEASDSRNEWVRRWTEWITHEERGLEDRKNARSLSRLENDMGTLCNVIATLGDIAPGVVQLGHRVKLMRNGVQRFRGELKATGVMFGGNIKQQMSHMQELVSKLNSAVGRD